MDFEIPLFDLNFGEAEEKAVLDTLRTRWISMGPKVHRLEQRFADHLGVEHTLGLTNCTAALHLALKALGVGPGDEVIVPSLTFVATTNAVRYVGADPVFADIRSLEDLSMDPDDFAAKITDRTKAVIPMHYGGFAAQMDSILSTARSHGIAVVEDAAHSPLADWQGKPLGSLGDFGCFSFFSNKNITCAEGGLLATNNAELAAKAKLMRAHGMTSLSFERASGHATRYDVVELGYNYRLDDIRGSLILAQMDRLAEDVRRRAELRAAYESGLEGLTDVILPYRGRIEGSSHYILPVVLAGGGAERRDAVRQRMAERGIQTSVHYPAVHRFSIYEEFRCDLPKTDHATDHEITLPMFPRLTEAQVETVCRILKESL